jgi:hypothetical protein
VVRQKSEMTLDIQLDDERPGPARGTTVSRPQDFEF